ncbi:amino acid carrier protein [Candidatus Dependentiae bacterium]|nr:amino acid carrier protein [Candidatus Dependentiae bacterium]
MNFSLYVKELSDRILIIPYIIVLLGCIIITIKTKFVQIRMFPKMLRLFFKKSDKENKDELKIKSKHALFTAISTSIGIGNIVGPIIAIKLGGPGALLGFIVAVFFGAATIFTEVSLAVEYRTPLKTGGFAGGPMQYLKKAFHPILGKIYAFAVAVLLLAWSTNQANTLADILQSYSIPTYLTGIFLATLTLIYLIGGIKKIGEFSSKIVPLMFILFCTISLWIIFSNIGKIPHVLSLIFKTALTKKALTGAGIGLLLRWGIAKGTQASEAGVGTATIPHSMAMVKKPTDQGILAMLSTYSVGFVCLLSGLVVLLTGTWQMDVPLGINMLAKSFAMYTPYQIGSIVLVICTFLFSLGSIIGNSYNGSQGFLHFTKNRFVNLYYLAMGIIIFFGCIFSVEFVWSFVDFFVIPVAMINIIAVVILLFKRKDIFSNI